MEQEDMIKEMDEALKNYKEEIKKLWELMAKHAEMLVQQNAELKNDRRVMCQQLENDRRVAITQLEQVLEQTKKDWNLV